jgi:hypothetical protein
LNALFIKVIRPTSSLLSGVCSNVIVWQLPTQANLSQAVQTPSHPVLLLHCGKNWLLLLVCGVGPDPTV